VSRGRRYILIVSEDREIMGIGGGELKRREAGKRAICMMYSSH
jgi:hypothetical protein